MQRWYVDVSKLRELWNSGMDVQGIAAELNTNPSTVYKLRATYRLAPRKKNGNQKPDPTPDEISKAAAAIRAKWSRSRLAEASSGGWTPPRV